MEAPILAPDETLFDIAVFLTTDSGLSSSKEIPSTLSTYSRSSTDILAIGTAILTPFILWRLIFPSLNPRYCASTLKDLDRSVHVLTFDESGSASLTKIVSATKKKNCLC